VTLAGTVAVSLMLAVVPRADGHTLDPALRAALKRHAPQILSKYRVPLPADFTGDWAEHRNAWSVRADFTGDGIEDRAALLVRRGAPGFALVVFEGAREGYGSVMVLEEQQWPSQGFGVAVAPAGRYKTAAGKGYSAAGNGPSEIVVTIPAIERYHFESWSGLWYWDTTQRAFKWVQTSD
jgi:hypothetical protein